MKAARLLLGWSVERLGAFSDTSYQMVRTFELTGRVLTVKRRPDLTDPVTAIRTTLEEAGVEFTDGDVPGVQLRKPGDAK
jgi:hypothetical protein